VNMALGITPAVEVVRTNRLRTATIKVVGTKVVVLVPKLLSDARIKELLVKKSTWIKKKLIDHTQIPIPKPREYVNGESLQYLGKNYRLKIINGADVGVKLNRGYIQVTTKTSAKATDKIIREQLINWYMDLAIDHFKEKTLKYTKLLDVLPRSISVRDYKSRWGSCSSKGDISFNWRVILAPQHIGDYVIVHELSHMIQHNHSPKFWKLVESILPNHQDCREWLKVNGSRLIL
jgi:predicted metal-dependent hydrolase